MSALLLTGPAVEPLSLAEAKAFLRVEHEDDDELIGTLILGARVHVEGQTRRALNTQSWRLVHDDWPADRPMAVWPAPVQEVTAARVYRADGSVQVLDPDIFVVDTAGAPARVGVAPGAVPPPGRALAGIEIDFDAGYGDEPTDVPEPLRQAMRLLIAHWYENRGVAVVGQSASALPQTVAPLLAPYKVLAL